MAQIFVKNASGGTEAIEKPLPAGRGAAAASNPVVLASEDKTSLDAVKTAVEKIDDAIAGSEMQVDVVTSALPAGAATQAGQDIANAALAALADTVHGGAEYEDVAASQTTQVLGNTGAVGDYLQHVLIVPATLSPGAVSIKDGSGSAITIFTGGASSVLTLHSFSVFIGADSVNGAWQITTGANVHAFGVGDFT